MGDERKGQVKVASVCMNSGADVEENFAGAERYCREAHDKGADWVLLPEMFNYMGPYAGLDQSAVDPKGGPFLKLRDLCQSLGMTLFAGSVGERPGTEVVNQDAGYNKVYNTHWAFDSAGNTIAKYRKTHLFNLRDEHQKVVYSEEQGFCPGDELVTVRHQGWNCGFAICYDIRFPDMFSKLSADQPLDLLVVPAAFTQATGKRHWHLLLQARAVELQCYVLAADQTGVHSGNRECYGHSVIVDPWGEILADTGSEPGVVVADISLENLGRFRGRLPVRSNQRRDLY